MSLLTSKTCIITNPSARGDKARSFLKQRQVWEEVGVIMETRSPGDAEKLASQAIENGFTTVIAAGGDGTVFEVLNGLVSTKVSSADYRLGVLPLGTVNVFAKELGMSMNAFQCKEVLLKGVCRNIDLPEVCFQKDNVDQRRYFAQLGGAGLDAFAIQEVSFKLKKKLGPLAYVAAGLKVMGKKLPKIRCQTSEGHSVEGKLVLIGNGAFYGGRFRIFPDAALDDGLLHALVFQDVKWLQLPWRGIGLFLDQLHSQSGVTYLKSTSLELESRELAYFELEGEVVGQLPARLQLSSEQLQVIAPI
jgi:diacylglycerol kinase (ATP)